MSLKKKNRFLRILQIEISNLFHLFYPSHRGLFSWFHIAIVFSSLLFFITVYLILQYYNIV